MLTILKVYICNKIMKSTFFNPFGLFILSLLVSIRICHKFINADQFTVTPVAWDDNFVKFIVNRHYLALTFQQLHMTRMNETVHDHFYLSESYSKLIREKTDSVIIHDILKKSTKLIKKPAPGRYFFVKDPNYFWHFQNSQKNTHILTLVGLLNEKAEKISDNLLKTFTFVDDFSWSVKFINHYNGTLFAGVEAKKSNSNDKLYLILLLRKPISIVDSTRNLGDFVTAGLVKLKSLDYNAIVESGDRQTILFGGSNLHFRDSFFKVKSELQVDDLKINCSDIVGLLSETTNPSCYKGGLPVKTWVSLKSVNSRQREFQKLVPVFLSSPENKISKRLYYAFDSNSSSLLTCNEDLLECNEISLPPKTRPLPNLTTVDTISGHLVVPVLDSDNYLYPSRHPLIECPWFLDCVSCEVYGHYHACEWVESSCQKNNTVLGTRTGESSCFQLYNAIHMVTEGKSVVVVKFNYDFDEELNMFMSFQVDDETPNEFDCATLTCVVYIESYYPREIYLWVSKLGGHPIYRKQFIPARAPLEWWIFLTILVLLIVLGLGITRFLIASTLSKRRGLFSSDHKYLVSTTTISINPPIAVSSTSSKFSSAFKSSVAKKIQNINRIALPSREVKPMKTVPSS